MRKKDAESENLTRAGPSGRNRKGSKLESCGRAPVPAPNVVDRTQVEQELARAREYAESIVETLHEPLVVLTAALIVQSANAAFYRQFQVGCEETLGRSIYDLGQGRWDTPALGRLLEDMLAGEGAVNDYEVRRDFDTLGLRVLRLNAHRLDRMGLILLCIRDVTDQSQADEALEKTNGHLRARADELCELKEQAEYAAREIEWLARLPKECPDPILRISTAGQILYGNVASLGLRHLWSSRGTAKVPSSLRKIVASACAGEEIIRREMEFVGRRYVLTVAPVPGADYANIFAYDITEHKRAEQARCESEERYRTLFEAAPCGIGMADLSGRMLTANPAMVQILGYTVEEFQTLNVTQLYVDPAEREELLDTLRREGYVRDWETRLRGKDGVVRNVRLSVDQVSLAPQEQPVLLTHLEDISEHKRIEEQTRRRIETALRASEVRLALAASGTRIGMFEWDVATGEALWTEQVARLLGLRTTTTTTTTTTTVSRKYHYHDWAERVHPEDLPRVEGELQRCMAERASYEMEYRTVWPDGSVHWLAARGLFQYDSSGQPTRLLGIVMDVTGSKQLEVSLRQANQALIRRTRQVQRVMLELSQVEQRERQRLAEILHDDLQQQLAATRFRLSILGRQVKGDASLDAMVEEANGLLWDAIQISRRLSHELNPSTLYHGDFCEVLEYLAGQMQARHGLVVRIETPGVVEVSSDGARVLLFRSAQEMLFNVVKHAGVKEATVRLRRRRRWLSMRISDQGRGFDPKIVKPAAGLGVVSIRERTELLGGRMKVRSKPGRGCTFLIVVPDGGTS